MSLQLRPTSLKTANEYVAAKHRHHKPTQGHKFSIGCERDGVMCGVVIIGRPVARMLDDGWTAEVTRLCTDGSPHVCSLLYAAARRAVMAMGYKRIITYILESEPGTSLKAAGWVLVGPAGGGTWDRPNRSRTDKHPLERKQLWESKL
jgi:tRNA A37 N6-isopentenylltransferase MiaA